VPDVTQLRYPGKPFLLHPFLRESYDVLAYEAAERFEDAAEAAGFDRDTLLAMLDQSVAFQDSAEGDCL
jgi:hypothetical protein